MTDHKAGSAEFERWCAETYRSQAYLHTSATSGEWEAWQAGAAAMQARCAAQPADCGNTPYDEGPFTLAQPATVQPAEPVAPVAMRDAALNTLAQVFHNGEEVEGDNGAAMMVDMALWNEGCEALESLVGEDEDAAPPAPAQPVEPVAYIWGRDQLRWNAPDDSRIAHQPLYAAPVAVPLTDEQVAKIVDENTYDDGGYDIWCNGIDVARAIERAHGIAAAAAAGDKP